MYTASLLLTAMTVGEICDENKVSFEIMGASSCHSQLWQDSQSVAGLYTSSMGMAGAFEVVIQDILKF